MASLLAILLIFAPVLLSCAAYTPQPATLLRIQSAAFAVEQQGFAIGVSPHLNPERNQDVFQADMRQAGILPLQIVMQNNGPQSLEVRREDFILELVDGRKLSPTPADLVALRLESSAGVAGWTLAFGLLGFLASSAQQGEADNARRADLSQKEIQDRVLQTQDRAGGFVFFRVPADVRDLPAATLFAKATIQSAGREIRTSLLLKELGIWNEANRPAQETNP